MIFSSFDTWMAFSRILCDTFGPPKNTPNGSKWHIVDPDSPKHSQDSSNCHCSLALQLHPAGRLFPGNFRDFGAMPSQKIFLSCGPRADKVQRILRLENATGKTRQVDLQPFGIVTQDPAVPLMAHSSIFQAPAEKKYGEGMRRIQLEGQAPWALVTTRRHGDRTQGVTMG